YFPELLISIGDTPSCSLVEDFSGVDEIRPGNFVFYDLMQYSLGACTLEQVSVALACPVVGKYPHRNEIVIHGGAIHFSKDFLYKSSGERIYGYVVKIGDKEWSKPVPGAYLSSLSQEHGIVRANREFIDEIRLGDVVGVLPVHSCLTANLMKAYLTLDGEAIGY
ncbi:MAG: alanine racemase, partial [Bacteroidales bacterium]|nr:alanine racemase [Bacteroidales bacterium]